MYTDQEKQQPNREKSVRVLAEKLNKNVQEQASEIGKLLEELSWVLLPEDSVPELMDGETKNPVPEPELVQLLMEINSRVGNNNRKLRDIISRLAV
jgi:hypothetical protein